MHLNIYGKTPWIVRQKRIKYWKMHILILDVDNRDRFGKRELHD